MRNLFALTKRKGHSVKCPARLPLWKIGIAWLGATLAIAVLSLVGDWQDAVMILGSFGASCLLIFAYPASPFAQPRNVIGGHFIASLTGLIFMSLFGVHWWSMATAVGTAIALMLLLRVPHPPAGSNPVIVMLGGVSWQFLWTPTLIGSIVLVLVALAYNNLLSAKSDGSEKLQYPTYWW